MASNVIRVGKKGPSKVPEPGSATGGFVLGSRPAVLRSPALDRIKPSKAPNTRDYGKAPALGGDTGMTGLS